MKNILVLLAHPTKDTSKVNAALFQAAQSLSHVTTVDLYEEYSNFEIDIKKEQQRLVDHDAIIFMFPMHWYSTPALLKQWQDAVLEYGFAFGASGDKLHGKTLLCVVSAGSNESVYQDKETGWGILRDLLMPIEKTAAMTGLVFQAPLVIFDSRTALEEGRLPSHVASFKEKLIGG